MKWSFVFILLLIPQYTSAAIEKTSGAILIFGGIFILPTIIIVILYNFYRRENTKDIGWKIKLFHFLLYSIQFTLSVFGGFFLLNIFWKLLSILDMQSEILFIGTYLMSFVIIYFLLGRLIIYYKK